MGAAACLASALCWAIAVAWFRRPIAEHGALAINLGKCWLATLLLGLAAWWVGDLGPLIAAPDRSLGLVAISGVAGLTLGDSALFAAVHRLGTHRALLFQTLGPVFAALLAYTFLDEQPTGNQLAGMTAVLIGVALALEPAADPEARVSISGSGMAYAVVAAFGQGAGIVLAKGGMADIPVVGASLLRLGAAALGLGIVLAATGELRRAYRGLATPGAMPRLFGPTLLGTFIAFLLMMWGIDRAPAAIAAVLLATVPIFSLFVDAMTGNSPLTVRGVAGTVIAIGGVAGLVL